MTADSPLRRRRLTFGGALLPLGAAVAWGLFPVAAAPPRVPEPLAPATRTAAAPRSEGPRFPESVDLSAAAASTLVVHPRVLDFPDGTGAWRLLVWERTADGRLRDVSAEAQIDSAGGLIRWEDGRFAAPMKAGEGKVRIVWKTLAAEIPVKVGPVDDRKPVRFAHDVLPILTRLGCNQGTCHGSQEGKGGLKFSLRGYDAPFDHQALVDDLAGRRVDLVRPERSLFMRKISGGLPHGGGALIDEEAAYYQRLREWVRQGAELEPRPIQVERLEVVPPVLQFGSTPSTAGLAVIAHDVDGTVRDVTQEAFFEPSHPDTAEMENVGDVKALRRGQTAILVRYAGRFAAVPVSVTGNRDGLSFVWKPAPQFNEIDRLVDLKLQDWQLLPSPVCTDAEFLRRASLDLTGLPPSPDDVRKFLADARDPQAKRAELVDRLLASPEFVEHWANRWTTLLQGRRKTLGPEGVWAFRRWVRQAVAQDMPLDRFVREMLAGEGTLDQTPAAAFYMIHPDAESAVEAATHLFLGVRFNCNRCHDHPFERWTQSQYFELAAYFAQVGRKPLSRDGDDAPPPQPAGMEPPPPVGVLVYDLPTGELPRPKSRRPATPGFPFALPAASAAAGGTRPEVDLEGEASGKTRRRQLAEWMTSSKNRYFISSQVNRLWAHLLGQGLIEPVDDLRAGNPPIHPELLSHLEAEFLRSGMSVRSLLRYICRSRVYQQSIQTDVWNEDDATGLSHALPRRLPAETLLDAINKSLDAPPQFPDLPPGLRANQLPDAVSGSKGGFLELFGRPSRESPCECERSTAMQLPQALSLINGSAVGDALANPRNRLARLAREQPDDAKAVEEIFLAIWNRPPTPREERLAREAISTAGGRLAGLQDLAWAMLNSPAFLFNR